MIPEEKSAPVFRALHEAFGQTDLEEIRRITRGLSSDLVFRIVVKGSPYLLRVMTRIDERMDPHRIFACMRAAAEAGLTPIVRYSNVEDGVSITDFVDAAPFTPARALALLPPALRRLHGLARFPKTFNYVTAHKGFIWRFRTAGLVPRGEVEEVFARYEQVCAVYPRADSDMVSCHMDLKPENILFDGQRIWLVDWQAAFVNDRYFDLAAVANFVIADEADECTYLEQYFGQPADEYQRARFFLMCQVVHMFYAAVFLLLGSAGKPISRNEDPSFGDFHRRIWAGEIDLANKEHQITYGIVHWERLLRNVRRPRFEEAIGIAAERERNELLLPSAP